MSQEIRTTLTLSVTNGNYAPPAWNESGAFTQNAIDAQGGVINCTTSMADVPLGSVTTPGFAMFKNLDNSATIDIGYDDSATFRATMSLKPGESCVFRFKSSVVPAVKAQSGTPKCQYWILQD